MKSAKIFLVAALCLGLGSKSYAAETVSNKFGIRDPKIGSILAGACGGALSAIGIAASCAIPRITRNHPIMGQLAGTAGCITAVAAGSSLSNYLQPYERDLNGVVAFWLAMAATGYGTFKVHEFLKNK